MAPPPIVELEAVAKRYGAGVEALRDVSLTVEPGELVAITGPSGSGKSTLLHLVGGLDRPTSGVVRVHGEDLASMPDDALTHMRRDRIGFVFQFFNLLPQMSALDNVMLPALLAGARARDLRKKAEAALARVGLEARASHRPDELSGGEMQRVAIARALLADPPLLLADEPTGNLDTKSGEAVLELLLGEGARGGRGGVGGGRTIMIVTHDAAVAKRCARVVSLRDGRLA
jgi:putative ABC transport system ATP-binding protein